MVHYGVVIEQIEMNVLLTMEAVNTFVSILSEAIIVVVTRDTFSRQMAKTASVWRTFKFTFIRIFNLSSYFRNACYRSSVYSIDYHR